MQKLWEQIVSGPGWLRTFHFTADWNGFGGRQESSVSDRNILKVHRELKSCWRFSNICKIHLFIKELSLLSIQETLWFTVTPSKTLSVCPNSLYNGRFQWVNGFYLTPYTTHPHTVRPGFPTSSTPGFPQHSLRVTHLVPLSNGSMVGPPGRKPCKVISRIYTLAVYAHTLHVPCISLLVQL